MHNPTPEQIEALLKAAFEAHKLLQTVVPAGSYGGPTSQRYRKHAERIDRTFKMLDDAIADAKGLP
jgi:hypothetical protein